MNYHGVPSLNSDVNGTRLSMGLLKKRSKAQKIMLAELVGLTMAGDLTRKAVAQQNLIAATSVIEEGDICKI